MKKMKFMAVAMVLALMSGCSVPAGNGGGTTASTTGSILGEVLTGVLQSGTLGNVITSVIGAQKVTRQNLIGSWHYIQPGCAFTSEQLLAKAGGEVVAGQIKAKLLPYYQQVGINGQNTNVAFSDNGTFVATILGKQFSGNWTYDESNSKVNMQGLLLSINCYAKRNANGIALLFEGKKLLTLLQTAATLSGNQTLGTISDISKSYDGVRIGFDFQ